MRRIGGSWALKGLGLGLVGLLTPELAWATCAKVSLGARLVDVIGADSTETVTATLLDDTELCFAEGWVDPEPLSCLVLTPGKLLTISVSDTDGDKTIDPIELPGLYLPEIPSSGSRSTVTISDATVVGECASTTTGGPSARVLVEGDHHVRFTDVALKGGTVYGLYADDGLFEVSFTDPLKVFADGFYYYPAVKLAAADADYTQTGGVISNNQDTSALKSYGATVLLNNVAFESNGGSFVSGGALFLQNGTATITGGSFNLNKAKSGGAIWGESSVTVTLDGVAFTDNTAAEFGGAVAASSLDTLTVKNGTSFVGDNAQLGGAIWSDSASTLVVEDVSFLRNVAGVSGGAIYAGTGRTVIGNTSGAPSFVSTVAPEGAAVTFASPSYSSRVAGAIFENILGGYAIDVSGAGSFLFLSELMSPNGLGSYGLLRVEESGVSLSSSKITGIDGAGTPTTLQTGASLIDVQGGWIELKDTVLCGFIAQGDTQPLVNLDRLSSSSSISGSTFMNLGGVGEPHRVVEINTTESVYLYNNSFIGQADGAQVGVYAESVGGIFLWDNLFHQLSAGLIVESIHPLAIPFVSHNLYSPSVEETAIFPPENTILGIDTLIGADPLFVRAFDSTRCSVWPYVTDGSPAVGPDVGVAHDGLGDTTQIGAWGLLLDGNAAAVDTDGDGHTIIDDCDDADGEVSPSAPERPGNGVDDDCDGEVDEGTPDTGDTGDTDDTGDDDTGDKDTDLEVRPDADGDGVPDDDDCAPNDEALARDCPSRFVYSGGRLGCAAAPSEGLSVDPSAVGLLIVALAGARRRRPPALV